MADLSKAMEQFAEVVGRAMGVSMNEAHANVKRIADSMMLQTATNTSNPRDALITRYQNDALFHAIVDTLANWICDAQSQPTPNVTSDDLRAACECAVLVSQAKSKPMFVGIWPSETEDAIELFTIDLDEARRGCRRGLTCLACEYWSPLAVNPPTPGTCAVDDPSVAYQPDDPACGYFRPKHRMCASCAHWNSAAHRCGLPPDSRHSGTKQANDGRQCPDFCEASVPKMMARGFNAMGTKPSALQYAKAKPADDVVDANPRMTAVALAGRRHGKTQANRALEEAIDALKKREQVDVIAQLVQMNAMTPADAKRLILDPDPRPTASEVGRPGLCGDCGHLEPNGFCRSLGVNTHERGGCPRWMPAPQPARPATPRQPCGACVQRSVDGVCAVFGQPVDADFTTRRPCEAFRSKP